MNDFARHASEGQQLMERDVRVLVKDAQDLLLQTANDAGAGYAEARQQLQERVHAAQQRLSAIGSLVRNGAMRRADASVQHARKHPWQWVGAGVTFALLVGLAFRGRDARSA